MTTTSKYSVEYRDKNGNLKQYLTPFVSGISWEWNRVGGCGRCNISLAMNYRKITFATMDDIQIRVAAETKQTEQLTNGDFKLWTAGDAVAPDDWTESGSDGNIAKESTITKVGAYSAKVTRGGSGYAMVHPNVATAKGITYWRGRTITYGCWVYATVENAAKIRIYDGSAGSPSATSSEYHPGDSTWRWLECTHTVQQTASVIYAFCDVSVDTSCYFDGASIMYNSTAPSSKLVYRGWVASAKPTTDGGGGDKIQLDVRGYFDLLKSIVIQDTGDEIEYTSQFVSSTVDDIVDTFITPNSDITKGTIDVDAFSADSLKFKTTVQAALETCADLLGNVEYGVDEDLVFFWKAESDTVAHKFIVGDNISSLKRQIIFDKLVNKIYFEGGKVAGSKYLRTATASDSITSYYLAEKVISNSSITTQSVADEYLSALLDQNSSPQEKFSAVIPETALRFEDNIPLGKISVYDAEHDKGAASAGVWGTASPAGGSGFVWGTTANGGSHKIWGGGSGALQLQVDSIKYELSETPGKFKLSISTGDTDNRFAAKIKQIENILESVRQAV